MNEPRNWLALVIVSLIILVMALSIHPIRAHDHNRPGLDDWYSELKSGKGPCCGGPSVDATTLDGPDWKQKTVTTGSGWKANGMTFRRRPCLPRRTGMAAPWSGRSRATAD